MASVKSYKGQAFYTSCGRTDQYAEFERACKRDDLPEEKVLSRMENQRLTQDECARISFRIDSDCSLEELEQRVRAVVRQLEDKQLIDN